MAKRTRKTLLAFTPEEFEAVKRGVPQGVKMATWIREIVLKSLGAEDHGLAVFPSEVEGFGKRLSRDENGLAEKPSDSQEKLGTPIAPTTTTTELHRSTEIRRTPDPVPAPSKPTSELGQMGLALDGDPTTPIGSVVDLLWSAIGEPFSLLAEPREKARLLLENWPQLDPSAWSREVADYWHDLTDDERAAVRERRKHGRRKNSTGVGGWISYQMRIKAGFARRDEAREVRDDRPAPSSSTRALTYAEREALRQRFRDSAYKWGERGGGVGDPMDFTDWLERRAAGELENDGDGPDSWVAATGGHYAD